MHISEYNKKIKTLTAKENQAEKKFMVVKQRFEEAEQELVALRNALTQAKNSKAQELKDLREVQKLSKKYNIPYEVDQDWIYEHDEWRCTVCVPEWFTDEQCDEIGHGQGDIIEGAYCWADALQQVKAFAEKHPEYKEA